MADELVKVNDKEYRLMELLGKGKGGYSYLASDGVKQYVLKQLHHEPCDYYQFGNKLEAELRDQNTLIRSMVCARFFILPKPILTTFQRILSCRMKKCSILIMNAMSIWKNGISRIGASSIGH